MPMRPAEIDALLKDGIALAQAGQRFEARRALQDVVEADPDRALAWMWLATITEDRATRIEYLERALTLDPTDETTRHAYMQLTGETFIPPLPSTGAAADTPAGSVRPKRSAILVAAIVLAMAVLAFAFVLLLDDGDESVRHSGPISSATINALLTPQPDDHAHATPNVNLRPFANFDLGCTAPNLDQPTDTAPLSHPDARSFVYGESVTGSVCGSGGQNRDGGLCAYRRCAARRAPNSHRTHRADTCGCYCLVYAYAHCERDSGQPASDR
jgi:hypothetical protein